MEQFIKEQKQRIEAARRSSIYKKDKAFREQIEKSASGLEHFENEMMKCE